MTASKGKERPALTDVPVEDILPPIMQSDPREVDRRRAFASRLETSEFVEHGANAGIVKVIRPTGAADNPDRFTGPPDAPPNYEPSHPGSVKRPRAEEPNVTVRMPEYVQQAIRMRAVKEKTTVRLVILRALRKDGFDIRDEDMTDDRGIVAKRRRLAR